jgi:hypothetical protein
VMIHLNRIDLMSDREFTLFSIVLEKVLLAILAGIAALIFRFRFSAWLQDRESARALGHELAKGRIDFCRRLVGQISALNGAIFGLKLAIATGWQPGSFEKLLAVSGMVDTKEAFLFFGPVGMKAAIELSKATGTLLDHEVVTPAALLQSDQLRASLERVNSAAHDLHMALSGEAQRLFWKRGKKFGGYDAPKGRLRKWVETRFHRKKSSLSA